MGLIHTLEQVAEDLLGFQPEIHGNSDIPTPGAAQVLDPIHRDQEMQPGQRPGMATPAHHPSHFVANPGPNHPGGPWSPTLGVGEHAAAGVLPPPIDESLMQRPFHSAHQHEAHLEPGPAPHHGPDPVPVFIVGPDTGENTITAAGNTSLTTSDKPQQLLARNPKRKRLLIRNEAAAGGASIRIGFSLDTIAGDPSGTAGMGMILNPGDGPLELTNSWDVYVVNAKTGAGQSALVTVIMEFGITGPSTRPVTAASRGKHS